MSLRKMSPQEFDLLTRDYLRRSVLSRRTFLTGAAALGMTAGLGLPGSNAGAAQTGGTLRVGRAEEPDTLDPHKTTLSVSSTTMDLIYEPLARRGFEGEVIPAFAESWQFSNENRTLTFKLKPGVKFHDGSPCDAEAVAWTVARHLDPRTASSSVFVLGPLERAEVIDPLQVAYHFTEPFIPVWEGLTIGYAAPISRKAVEADGDQYGRRPVGAGPFRLVSWSTDRGMRLERNDDYAPIAAPARIDAVEFFHYPEDATRMAAFETGEINAIYTGNSVPLDGIRRLRNNPDATLIERPAQLMRALVFNQKRPPFNNPVVRRAFCHAIDQKRLIAFALDGLAVAATSPIASSIVGYSPKTAELGYAYDPAKGKALLAEAGIAPGLKVKLVTSDNPIIRRTAEVVQAQLRDIGVDVAIETMPIAQWSAVTSKGEQDMVISTYAYGEADVVYPFLHSKGSLNRAFHENADLDAMIARQRVTADTAARQDILDKIQAFVVTEAYWKPLFEPLNFAVVSKDVVDARMNTAGELRPDLLGISE
ncbi:peptide/nickel transport system substrate-binding protein [Phyllobacterium myrsinacearum]|uniref:ABC transporter substrate-binding protein n=1 Tax=Phyllobacterium myrsinacearum TaxID=28101 RepID=UPI0010292619|nr:ABC transporter substrate-binding protein [Phyllobacterium myrsinacearum]RZS79505.1 peptide/nickel transport system substrate-binding protein [Phyllobacterium myrsinacearum]